MADEFDDLDIDLDAQFGDDNNNDNTPTRGLASKSTQAFLNEFKGEMPADDVKSLTEGALPSIVGDDAAGKLAEATVSFKDSLEESTKYVKTKAKPLLRRLNKAIPEDSFMSSVVGKLSELAGIDEESSSAPSKEELRLREINNSILAALGNSDAEQKRELIKQNMEHGMAASTDAKLASILAYSMEASNFNSKVTRSYYMKSLELQYRHLYMARDTKDVLRLGFDSLTKLNSVIAKNTGLPDYLKLRTLEAVSSKFRNSLIENFQSSVSKEGGTLDRTMNAFKKNISNIGNNIGDALMSGEDMADMMGIGNEKDPDFDMSADQMAGMSAGDAAKKMIGKLIGREIRSSKTGAKLDSELNSFVVDSSAYFDDKKGATENKYGKKLFGFLSDIMRVNDGGSADNVITSDANDNAAMFTNRVSASITKIIPGYLSKILAEVSGLRAGKDVGELTYSYKRDEFISKDTVSSDFKDLLKRDSKQSRVDKNIIQVVKNLSSKSGVELSKQETLSISKALYDFSRLGYSMSPKSLENKGFYKTIPNEQLSTKFKLMVSKYGVNDDGTINSSAQSDLSDNLESIKKISRNNDSKRINDMIDNGQTDSLRDMGIVKYDKKLGTNVIDNDKLNKLRRDATLSTIGSEYDNIGNYSEANYDHRVIGDGYIKRFGIKLLGLSINDLKDITSEQVIKFGTKVEAAYKKSGADKMSNQIEKKIRVALGQHLRIDYRLDKIGGKAMFYARVADIARTEAGAIEVNKFLNEWLNKHSSKKVRAYSKLIKRLILKDMTKVMKSDKYSTAKTILSGSADTVNKFMKENAGKIQSGTEDFVNKHGDTTLGEGLSAAKKKVADTIKEVKNYYKNNDLNDMKNDASDVARKGKEKVDEYTSEDSGIGKASKKFKDTFVPKKDPDTGDTESKTMTNTIVKAINSISKSIGLDRLISIDENITELNESDKEHTEEEKKDKKESKRAEEIARRKKKVEDKKKARLEKETSNKQRLDSDGDGKRDGGWRSRLDKLFKRREKTSAVNDKGDPKDKKGGMLGMLGSLLKLPFSMIGGIASLLSNTVGGILGIGGMMRTAGLALGLTGTILGGGVKLLFNTISKIPKVLRGLGWISKKLFTGISVMAGGALNMVTKGKGTKVLKGLKGKGGLALKILAAMGLGAGINKFLSTDDAAGTEYSDKEVVDYLGKYNMESEGDINFDENNASDPSSDFDMTDAALTSGAIVGTTAVANTAVNKAVGMGKNAAVKLGHYIKPTAAEKAAKSEILTSFKKAGKTSAVFTDANSARKVVKNGKAVIEVGKYSKGIFTVTKVLKKIPGLGIILGAGFAVTRLMDGDFVGAAMEMAAGIATTIPFIGLPLSIAIDMSIMARDANGVTPVKDENGIVMKSWKWVKDGVTSIIPGANAAKLASNIYDSITGNDDSVLDKDIKSNGNVPLPSIKLNEKLFGASIDKQVATSISNTKAGYASADKLSKVDIAKASISNMTSNVDDDIIGVSEKPSGGSSQLKGDIATMGYMIRYVESNNKYNIAKNLGDKGGISFGAYQLTETSGSLKRFMIEYIKLKPMGVSKAKNYNQLMGKTKYKGNRNTFKTWLRKIGATKEGVKAQDIVFQEMYYKPGLSIGSRFKNKDVQFHIIDAYHNGGPKNAKYVANYISKAKTEDLVTAEKARIKYWKTKSGWSKWGNGWTARLKKLRILIKKFFHGGAEIPESTYDSTINKDNENPTEAKSSGGLKTALNAAIKTIFEFFGVDSIDTSNTESTPTSSGSSGSIPTVSAGKISMKDKVDKGKGVSVSSTVDSNVAKVSAGNSKFSRLGQKVGNIGEISPSTMNGGSIKNIVVHCTATPTGRPVGASEVDSWHKKRGWNGIGYHYIVNVDGSIEYGRNVNYQGAHVEGHNKGTIGVAYSGGVMADGKTDDKDNMNPEQQKSLVNLVHYLAKINNVPTSNIIGHNDFQGVSKSCPNLTMANIRQANFDAIKEDAESKKEPDNKDNENKTVPDKGLNNNVNKATAMFGSPSNNPSFKSGIKKTAAAIGTAAVISTSMVASDDSTVVKNPLANNVSSVNKQYPTEDDKLLAEAMVKYESPMPPKPMDVIGNSKPKPTNTVTSNISSPTFTLDERSVNILESIDDKLGKQVSLQQKTVDLLSNMSGLPTNDHKINKVDEKKKVVYNGSKKPKMDVGRSSGKVTQA